MGKLHKLSEWRPDMPARITGLTTEELEAIARLEELALTYAPLTTDEARAFEKAKAKVEAEIERRKNGE